MISKYCSDSKIVEWFRNPIKFDKNGSIRWKTLVLAFPLVGNWSMWKIGNGKRDIIGENLWEREGEEYMLSYNLIIHLRAQTIQVLYDAQSQQP